VFEHDLFVGKSHVDGTGLGNVNNLIGLVNAEVV
jgi:hypothetical protein